MFTYLDEQGEDYEDDEIYDLPSSYEINEYSMMEEFIDNIEDDKHREMLFRLIQGKGAFRRFKDYCIDYGFINDWYKLREDKLKEIAINWCKDHDFEYLDDTIKEGNN